MKKYLRILLILLPVLSLVACSDDPPSVRVFNERSTKANVQIKTTTNTININDVAPGATTNYQDVSEGKLEITATIQNETISPTNTTNVSNNNNYTIVISNTNPPSIKINSSSK